MKKKLLFWPLSFFLLVVLWYTYHLFSNTPTFCPYFTWNTTAYFFNKGKWDNIENINTQTLTFLYKARSNDLLYWIPCYFKDKNFAYRNDQVLFSGFDYATFQILTGIYVGMSKDLKSDILIQKQREDTCVWGCFEDKHAIYYDEWNSWPKETNGFVRNTTKRFPNTSDYDEVRNKVHVKNL